MAQNHRIAEIKNLSDELKERLAAGGITTAEDLLARAASPTGRAQLARELGVEAREVTEWVNRADLMRITGVGTEMANLLEEGGVDSCKELQHRLAENLHAKLKQINDERSITQRAPSLTQVTAWIDEAKTLVRGGEADEEPAAAEAPAGIRSARAASTKARDLAGETEPASSDVESESTEVSMGIRAASAEPAAGNDQQGESEPDSLDQESLLAETSMGISAAGSDLAEESTELEEPATDSTDQEPATAAAPMGVRAARAEVQETTGDAGETASTSEDAERDSVAATKTTPVEAATTSAPAPANFTPAPTEGPGWIRIGGKSDCPQEFPIKGNGSSRRFHVPGQLSYPATNAEFCFADEEAAALRGFRPTGR